MKHLVTFAIATAVATVPAIAAPNPNAAPNFGEATLRSGFPSDPRVVSVRAGGSNNAASIAANCAGFISDAPDFRVAYAAGTLPLIISVAASADTTLVINGPDGRWYCDDDGGVAPGNPAVRFSNPASGRYEIWVGTYRAGSAEPARLHISEVGSQ